MLSTQSVILTRFAQDNHHAGDTETYLSRVVDKTTSMLERLLPTLGRKLRIEVEVPAYCLADAEPLLKALLLGLVKSSASVL